MNPTSTSTIESPNAEGPRRWRPPWLSRDLLCLFTARALRSFTQGYLAVIVPIYVTELGYDAEHLGLLVSISAFTGAILAAMVGVLADRFGRKRMVIGISLLTAAGSAAFALSRNFALIVASGAIGTIGYNAGAGFGGGWGPYYPAAQSLVAEQAEDRDRTTIFGGLSFVAVVAAAFGSLLAAMPGMLHRILEIPMLSGFRLLFYLSAAFAVATALAVVPVREVRWDRIHRSTGSPTPAPAPSTGRTRRRKALGLSRGSWRLVVRFMITNSANGLSVGMLGPFVVYWFYRRYDASSADLARLFFVVNLAAAIPYLISGPLARRFGTVKTIAVTRGFSSIILVFLTLMPTYWAAALLYTLRMVVNVLSVPARQSYMMGVIDPSERASAAGLSNLPSQVTRSAAAYLAGYLMQNVALDLPILVAGAVQGFNSCLYYGFFRSIRPPEETESAWDNSPGASS